MLQFLSAAVRGLYVWKSDITDDAIIASLLQLNLDASTSTEPVAAPVD